MADDQTPLTITSAEGLPTELAPSDYRPTATNSRLIYDDEVAETPCDGAWHDFFAGGSSRPHWVMQDTAGKIHFVETTGWGGSYEVYSEDYQCHFANAYDAFWYAEQQDANSGIPLPA